MVRIAIVLVIVILIDWYSYQAFKTVFTEHSWIKIGFWVFSISLYLFVAYGFLTFSRSNLGPNFGRLISLLVLSLIPKLIVLGFMFGEDILRFLTGIFYSVAGHQEGGFLADRRKFVSQTALIISAIPFLGILHGVLIGKYRYRVINHTLEFDDLPEEFDGFKITQISDIHSGSFD
ncbi:MAG: metallophosphoesterase, partial [Algoriphagus sp.]